MEESQQVWDWYVHLRREERIETLFGSRAKHLSKQMRQEKTQQFLETDPLLQQLSSASCKSNPELYSDYLELYELLKDTVGNTNTSLHTLRKHHKDAELYRAALQEIKDKDPAEQFSANLEQYVYEDTLKLNEYLTSSDLMVYSLSPEGNTAYSQLLTVHNAESFFSMFEGSHFQLYLEQIIFKRKLERELIRRLTQAEYPCTRQALDVAEKGKPSLFQQMARSLNPLFKQYLSKLQQGFPVSHILQLVGQRKKYRKCVSQYKRLLEIRTAVLKAIPEHYKDLYPAARAMERKFVLHIGPTNSGKTYDAVTRLEESGNGVYLAPLRLLAYEQFDTINHDGIPCNLLTGEEEISVVCAQITASTIEMANLHRHYRVAVIDEGQMISDPERGGSWSAAVLGLQADEIHICASPDAEQLLRRIIMSCGDSLEIHHHQRQIPLKVEKKNFHFPDDVKEGDALVVFSKRSVHGVAAELQRARKGIRASIIYGALPYDVRHEEARRFREHETDVVVATDAIGMGLNLPIQRIVFLEMTKFDGQERRDLTDPEIKQIAGRAGRFGIYDEGYVAASGGQTLIREAIENEDVPLTTAMIQFPETLLGIDAPLTEILRRWNEIADEEGWNKAKTERHMFLANLMENKHTDKAFLYRFITIPFDEKSPELLRLWQEMYLAEEGGEHLDVLSVLPEPVSAADVPVTALERLEQDYRICDLCANYTRLFLSTETELREEIEKRKELLSKSIIGILASKKLRGKTCRRCGRSIPWDYPFSVCEKCFQHERNQKRMFRV